MPGGGSALEDASGAPVGLATRSLVFMVAMSSTWIPSGAV